MSTNKILHCVLLTLVVGTVGGCTSFHPDLSYIKPPDTGVKPHAVGAALVLTKELCDHKIVSKLHSSSESYEYPVGVLLCGYAQDAAKECFRSVQVANGDSAIDSASSPAIVLCPRLVKASHIMPLFHDQQMTFVVEWTAKEPATGKMILLMTVEGKATAPMRGVDLGPSGAKCIQLALADLYKNTVAALANSMEIQQYVASRQK